MLSVRIGDGSSQLLFSRDYVRIPTMSSALSRVYDLRGDGGRQGAVPTADLVDRHVVDRSQKETARRRGCIAVAILIPRPPVVTQTMYAATSKRPDLAAE